MSSVPVARVLDETRGEILQPRGRVAVVKRRGWLMRRMLVASDVIGLAVAFGLAEWIARAAWNAGYNLPADALLFGVSLPVWVVMAKLYGLYDRDEERADHSTANEVAGVVHLVTIGTWAVLAVVYLTGFANLQLPRLLSFWLLAIVAVPLTRSLARSRCRRSAHYLQNTLIVGAGEVGQQIARKLIKHPEYGINLVGFVDSRPRERAHDLAHLAVLGTLDDVPGLVGALEVERVIVAFSDDDHEAALALIRALNERYVQVDVVPRFFEVIGAAVDIHGVEGLPLIGIRPPRLSRSSAFLKRALDVAGAVCGLVILSPLLGLVALGIKLDSRGPIFFRQVRMGVGDKKFRIVKFRTMSVDADARKAEVAHLNKHARDGGDARMFKIDADPRVTRLGRVLRRFSVDELAQLWNVIRGDMSLVGPRPLILDEHIHVTAWAGRRLDLRPGMTGYWQVLGSDDIPFAEMVNLDYLYITNWSLAGDIGLLLRTLPAVIRRGT